MSEYSDEKYNRTHEAIKDAFENLVSTIPGDDITVTRLTKEAGINRKTFYLHFDSIGDLLDTYVESISARIIKIMDARPLSDIYTSPGYLLPQLSALFQEHNNFAKRLFFSGDYAPFTKKIADNVAENSAGQFRKSFNMSKVDSMVLAHFFINNTIQMFQLYLNNPGLMTRQELQSYTSRLNKFGLSAFSGFTPK